MDLDYRDVSSRTNGPGADVSQLHSGQHDVNNKYDDRNLRNYFNRNLWRRLQKLVWNKCDAQRRHNGFEYNVFSNNRWRRFPAGGCRKISRYRGNDRYYPHNRSNKHNYFLVGLLSISLLSALPLRAEDDTHVTAAPQASSSGSVSNQAIQINQGGYSTQSFGRGHYCNSSTLTVTPFYTGNDNHPNYTRGQNFGIQATMSFPLDGEMVSTCKNLAKKKLEKERLDYALVRALKCAELLSMGYMIRPESPYSVICSDVVPIVVAPTSTDPQADASNEQ